MISDICKLVRVALTPPANRAAIAPVQRRGRRVNRTDALLGQGSALISRGCEMSARDVRMMKARVLAHDFNP